MSCKSRTLSMPMLELLCVAATPGHCQTAFVVLTPFEIALDPDYSFAIVAGVLHRLNGQPESYEKK